jgi:phosphoglycerate kinase
VLGGAKVSDKIGVIERFVEVADQILIGGAMANTFLAYKGLNVGKSKYEPDQEAVITRIYEAAKKKVGDRNVDNFLLLPQDVAVAKTIDASEKRRVVSVHEVAADERCLDIGDAAIERFAARITKAATVVWNGTLGYAELPAFAHGSARAALALATHPAITSIIGGGDTADFVLHWDSQKGGSFSHVSTGGGASLELMAGEKLPGIEHLLDA